MKMQYDVRTVRTECSVQHDALVCVPYDITMTAFQYEHPFSSFFYFL